MTRLLIAAALVAAAAGSAADIGSGGSGDLRSPADRHWLAYCELHRTQ